MVNIIEESPKRPKFLDQLLGGVQRTTPHVAEALAGQHRSREEAESIKRLTGQDVSGLSPELRKVFLEKHFGAQGAKMAEKHNSLSLGLQTINEMRRLIPSAGPSNYLQGLAGGETTKNRAELEALGRSLIPLVATGVPIRNQKEFEEYRKIITNPNSRQAELEGALNGLQGLFERSLAQSEVSEEKSEKQGRVKFNKAHPEHKAKAEQLMNKFNDKSRVRKELEREFEF